MKSYTLFFGIFIISSLCSLAQEERHQNISPGDRSKMLADQVALKINLTKSQKDSLNTIFMQFADDIQKYRAQENDKVFNFMVKSRDEKVKNLLHDENKYEKYLLILEDMKKRHESQQSSPEHQHQGGQHDHTGTGKPF